MKYHAAEFEAGKTIFHQGDKGLLMYLVQEGQVEVLQDLGGEMKRIAVLERGDFFGEMAVLEAEPRTHSVRAITPAKLVEIDRAGFQHLLARNPEIALRMIRKLSRRLATAEDMLVRSSSAAAVEATLSAAEILGNGRLIALLTTHEFELPQKQETTVGRLDPINNIHPDIDLTGSDPQFSISRRHARVLRRGAEFFIVEEQATNGTHVNGKRLTSERPVALRSGDEILFGAVQVRFMVD